MMIGIAIRFIIMVRNSRIAIRIYIKAVVVIIIIIIITITFLLLLLFTSLVWFSKSYLDYSKWAIYTS